MYVHVPIHCEYSNTQITHSYTYNHMQTFTHIIRAHTKWYTDKLRRLSDEINKLLALRYKNHQL